MHIYVAFAPKPSKEKECTTCVPSASVVGILMYVMVCTRPDLAHAVSVVTRFMRDPSKKHRHAVKMIFRDFNGTSNVGLSYGCDS